MSQLTTFNCKLNSFSQNCSKVGKTIIATLSLRLVFWSFTKENWKFLSQLPWSIPGKTPGQSGRQLSVSVFAIKYNQGINFENQSSGWHVRARTCMYLQVRRRTWTEPGLIVGKRLAAKFWTYCPRALLGWTVHCSACWLNSTLLQ